MTDISKQDIMLEDSMNREPTGLGGFISLAIMKSVKGTSLIISTSLLINCYRHWTMQVTLKWSRVVPISQTPFGQTLRHIDARVWGQPWRSIHVKLESQFPVLILHNNVKRSPVQQLCHWSNVLTLAPNEDVDEMEVSIDAEYISSFTLMSYLLDR